MGSRFKTTEEFKNDIERILGNDYELIGEYINHKTRVDILHKVCNTTNSVLPSYVTVKQRGCYRCSGKMRRTQEMWEDEVHQLSNGEYSVIGKYVNNRKKIMMKHNLCNNEWEISPSNFKKGHRCPKCSAKTIAQKLALPHEVFLERFNACQMNENNEYTLMSRYQSLTKKVKIKHNACGNVFSMLPDNFVSKNQGCPKCKVQSLGELKIRKWLEAHTEYDFDPEYYFDNLRGKKNRPLRFDFAIFKDEKLILLIEYDGRQHYKNEPSSLWQRDTDSFENIRARDMKKNNYCIKNNIPLLRISYKNYNNIEEILDYVMLEKCSETIPKGLMIY